MKAPFFLFICVICFPTLITAQSHPIPLRADITINRVMTVRKGAVRLAQDSISKNLFYNDASGNIFQVIRPLSGTTYDTLMYTTADHGIDFPECIAFHDSILYVLGNNTPNAALTTGILRKGILQKNGKRTWKTVMLTEPHQTCGAFDHKFSGMVLSPAGDSITINSGSRGDHGEVETNKGLYPDLRITPLTTKLFRISVKDSTYLQNNDAWLASSGFVYAQGIRNNFSMAYNAKGQLFGLENSGDRDHSDEMNWLRRGRHYGFPYRMGDYQNPQQCNSYDCTSDKMINHCSGAWRAGAFHNDPTFPAAPSGIKFENPIQNIGPDCDKFRDSITGKVRDASDLGISIGSFTAHRSPLGLVFDNDSILNADLRGEAFMLSWTKGLDSTGGFMSPYDTSIGPFVDPSQDLTHLHLMYDAKRDSYNLSATRIVADFANPVDAVIDSNKIYVLENGYTGTAGLYAITMPTLSVGIMEQKSLTNISCYPNPATDLINISIRGNASSQSYLVRIENMLGQRVLEQTFNYNLIQIETSSLPKGVYFAEIISGAERFEKKIVIQ